MMELLDVCRRRYSGRNFDRNRPIPQEILEKILEAARLAPTGCNSQQWKVLVLESQEALEKAEACSECVYNAPMVLLFLYDRVHPDSALDINSVNVGLSNGVIAATHAMLEAAEQGVDSCWVCWFYEAMLREKFHIPENWSPVCLLPQGYDQDGPSERHTQRKPMEELAERL